MVRWLKAIGQGVGLIVGIVDVVKMERHVNWIVLSTSTGQNVRKGADPFPFGPHSKPTVCP